MTLGDAIEIGLILLIAGGAALAMLLLCAAVALWNAR